MNATISNAQVFFSKGYAITQTGDTIQGEIRYKSNTSILIKHPARQTVTYTTDQLTSYTVEGSKLVTIGWTEGDSTRKVFAKELLVGTISLYGLEQAEGELQYLLRLPDQTVVPLRGKAAWNELHRIMDGCTVPSFRVRLESNMFRYAYPYFEDIVKRYNHCVAPQEATKKSRKPFSIEIGILAGVYANQWKYGAVEDRFYPSFQPNGLYPAYRSFTYGGYVMLLPKQRFSVILEGHYGKYRGERSISLNNPLFPDPFNQRIYSFWKSYWAFPVSGRLILIDKAVKGYVKAGFMVVTDLTLGGHIKSVNNNYIDYDIGFQRTYSVGYLLGAGARFKLGKRHSLSAELRTAPHIIKDGGATRIGDLRSYQFVLLTPIYTE